MQLVRKQAGVAFPFRLVLHGVHDLRGAARADQPLAAGADFQILVAMIDLPAAFARFAVVGH